MRGREHSCGIVFKNCEHCTTLRIFIRIESKALINAEPEKFLLGLKVLDLFVAFFLHRKDEPNHLISEVVKDLVVNEKAG